MGCTIPRHSGRAGRANGLASDESGDDAMSDGAFDAFRVFDEGGTVGGRVVQLSLDDLSQGEVVIKTAFSSVNYKDALAATGAGKIMRRFRLVRGVDLSGTVVSS